MIFIGAGNRNAFKQEKRTAQEIVTAVATSSQNPLKFFGVPSGEVKNIMFKNNLGAHATIAAVNKQDMLKRAASYGGISIAANNVITFINPQQTIVSGQVFPATNDIYNAAQEWLQVGTKFKLQGSVNNDNRVFVVASIAITGANMAITLNINPAAGGGAQAANEVIAATAPIKLIPFQVVDLFDVLDGDSISIDLRANNITLENHVDFYVYTLSAPQASSVNAIRAYILS
jgi:hypothetical protein